MEKKKILFGVVIVSVIISVGLAAAWSQGSSVNEVPYYEPVVAKEAGTREDSLYMEAEMPAPGAAPAEQMVIKTSYMSLEVQDFRTAADAVSDIARKYGGYVADSSVRDYGGRKVGYVSVRVPTSEFEKTIKEIETVGILQEENVSLEDVTEQYIDLEARLENLKRQEKRYLEILEMATTVEDVLTVETQLERIRGDIESLQGSLNYLDNRIDLSTIQVQLSEPEKIAHESGIGKAFSEAAEAFLSAIRGIIIFMGFFVPIAVFLTLVSLAGYYIYKKASKGR